MNARRRLLTGSFLVTSLCAAPAFAGEQQLSLRYDIGPYINVEVSSTYSRVGALTPRNPIVVTFTQPDDSNVVPIVPVSLMSPDYELTSLTIRFGNIQCDFPPAQIASGVAGCNGVWAASTWIALLNHVGGGTYSFSLGGYPYP